MKTNAIIRIILFSLAILVLLGILLAGLGVGLFMADFDSSVTSTWHNTTTGEQGTSVSFDADEIQELEIEWTAGTITLTPADNTDQIHIAESAVSNAKYQMICTQSPGKVSIEFCEENFSGFGISNAVNISKDLQILVPEGWVCEELDIDAASASVNAADLVIKKVDFDGASGICTFENCLVESIELDTASGDINFSGTLDTLDVDAMSANCRIEVSNVPSRIDVDSMSGDLDLTLPEYCGFTVSLDTMSGAFSTDFKVSTSVDTKAFVHGDGSCRIHVNAMSGDVAIHKG